MAEREREFAADMQQRLRKDADGMREALEGMPAALDVDAVGRADTAKLLNDHLSALFKASADQVALLDAEAAKFDPERGTYDDLPIELRERDPGEQRPDTDQQ